MLKKLFRFLLRIFLWFIGISIFWVLLYKYVPVPYTPLMAIRALEGDSTYSRNHKWVPIDEISVHLQLAVICAEDQNFLTHNGFDYEAIRKAYEKNAEGKRIRGGSTISQQTAKNVFLWPARSWFRKAMEAYFTVLIELFWSKERILEIYLNSIEMGNGIYGAEAASEFWFQKHAENLSSREAASLAAILPSPRRYQANPPGPYIVRQTNWILQQMQYFGPFDLKKPPSKNKTK